MPLTPRQNGCKPHVRRLANKGWSVDAIARAYKGRLTRAEVRAILDAPARPTSPVGPARPIWSRLATKVRKLLWEEGKSAEEVAALLDLDAAKVADFLERLTPRQAHHRRQGVTINRPRSRREQEALREWTPNRAGDERDGVMLPADEVLDLVEPPERLAPPLAIAWTIPEPTIWEGGPVDPRLDRTPGRRDAKARRHKIGPDDARIKLDAATRQEIRRLARLGSTAAELARRYGVNESTIRDLLRGVTHRDDGAEPIPPPPRATIGSRPAAAPAGVPYERQKYSPGCARLTPEDRAEIRRLAREEGWGCRRLATRFGVNRDTIRSLLLGETWADDIDAAPYRPRSRPDGWREPDGSNRSRRGNDDQRARDLVMLPEPAAPPPPPAIPEPTAWDRDD